MHDEGTSGLEAASALKIIVDSREPELVLGFIRERHVRPERAFLRVGDYVLSPECAVERKTVRDFMDSLFDGRLFEQARALKDAYFKPLMVIEGDLAGGLSGVSNPASFWGALLMLQLDVGLSVLPTPSLAHTVDALCALARRLQRGSPQGPGTFFHSGGGKPKLQAQENLQLYVVSSLPGVGGKLGRRLLERFGTVRDVFGADRTSLAEVEGLGPIKAARIAELLDRRFSSPVSPTPAVPSQTVAAPQG